MLPKGKDVGKTAAKGKSAKGPWQEKGGAKGKGPWQEKVVEKGWGKDGEKGGKGGKGKDVEKGKEAPKGSGAKNGKGSGDTAFANKEYGASLQSLIKGTSLGISDIDAKALQLLDALNEAGKSEAAVAHLAKSLEGVAREKVGNWKAYVFTLLRAYDPDTYNAMKEARGQPRSRRRDDRNSVLQLSALSVSAPEFTPGKSWAGAPIEEGDADAKDGIVFQVECKTAAGESVAMSGSDPVLGSWVSSSAHPLVQGTPPLWKSGPLKVANDAEYKFVVLGADKAVVRWEPIEGNRKLSGNGQPKVAKFGEK